MSELARLLLLVALAGSAVTFMGSAAIWFMDEDRRVRRALRHVLRGEPEVLILARGRGRGAGFSFATGLAAVAWDSGAWCLIYRIDELMGAELLIDGAVAGRVFRGEARRALDQVAPQASQISLRLIFDDPRHPDFDLDLWMPGDAQRRESSSPAAAVQEANRWLARCEAIVRRPQPPRSAPVPPAQAPAPAPPLEPVPAPAPMRARPVTQAPPPVQPLAAPIDAFNADDHAEPGFDLDEPPWALDPSPPLTAPYKPVSKARRERDAQQSDLPFDLDD
jgi:hypothetical protein